MRRLITTLALTGFLAFGANAVPAMRITKDVRQPDGSTVTLYLKGDEHCGGFFTSDGYAAAINAEGYAVYSSIRGKTDILIHNPDRRTQREADFLAAEGSSARLAPRREQVSTSLDIATGNTQVPHFGSPHIPIILADYTDIKFRDGEYAKETFENFFNLASKSAFNYFYDASAGQFTPQFHLIGPVNLSRERKYYGEHLSSSMPDANIFRMVTESCQLADPDTDFSIFDNDGDGVCDVVIILYAGVGEASSNVSDAVWPCQSTLTGVNSITCDGIKMARFAVFNELNGDNRTIAGVGTFCHEFSHCLGLPDIYDVNYTGTFGMDKWSVMDYGSYNDNGNTPVGYSAYEKAFMGWFQPVIAQENTFYSLPVQNVAADEAPQAVAVVNRNDHDEYYILENRRRQGWDTFSEADGLMITHVNFKSNVWSTNSVNTGGNNFITIIPADNSRDRASLGGDLWPNGSRNSLTNVTTPAALTFTGNFMSQPITDISIDPDTKEVSFWVSRKSVFDLAVPELASDPDVSTGGAFTAFWNPSEGATSYMLQAWPAAGVTPLPQEWVIPAVGFASWEKNDGVKNYPNGSTGAYTVLGNTNITGELLSPATVEADNGAVTVWISAHKYGTTSGSQIIVTLTDETGKEIDKSTFAINNKDDEYFPVCFTNLSNEKRYRVSVGNLEVGKRVMLTGILVFDDDATTLTADELTAAFEDAASLTENTPVTTGKTTADRTGRVTVRGIPATSHSLSGLSAGNYNYRVKGVSGTGSSRRESLWSLPQSVEVSEKGASVKGVIADGCDFSISGRTIIAPAASTLFTPSGLRIKASAEGRFDVAPGLYILTCGSQSVKVIVK